MTVRIHTFQLVFGEVDLDSAEECPTCGFDALMTVPVLLLSERGVTPFASRKACWRCWQEAHPEEAEA